MPVHLPIRPEGFVVVDDAVAAVLLPYLRQLWHIRRKPGGLDRPVLIRRDGTRWGEQVLLARWIARAPPDRFTQHLNGDVLDCRRANLRLVVSRGEAGLPRPA